MSLKKLLGLLIILNGFLTSTIAQTIHDAARQGDLEKVKMLVENTPELVNSKDELGRTPIFIANRYGQIEVFKFFIVKGADVNIKDNNGNNTLHNAVMSGFNYLTEAANEYAKEFVEILLENGVDVKGKNNRGDSALKYSYQDEITALLLKYGVEPTIYDAARLGFKVNIEHFINQGFDINEKDGDGLTLLHLAIYGRNKEIVELLIKNGADLNTLLYDGMTVLDRVIFSKNSYANSYANEITDLLISHGAKHSIIPDPEINNISENIRTICITVGRHHNIITAVNDSDGILLVDTGFPHSAEVLKKTIHDLGKGDLKFIINTHLHGDHIKGNIIAEENVKIINYSNLEEMASNGIISRRDGSYPGNTGNTFKTYYILKFNGEDVLLIPFPGIHSETDIFIYFTNSKIAFTGDVFLSSNLRKKEEDVSAFIERIKNSVIKYGNLRLEFLEKVLNLVSKDTIFIPGHDNFSDIYKYRNVREYTEIANNILKNR